MKKFNGVFFLFFLQLVIFFSVNVFASEPEIQTNTVLEVGRYLEKIEVANVPYGCNVKTFKNGAATARIISQKTTEFNEAAYNMDEIRTGIWLDVGDNELMVNVACPKKVIKSFSWERHIPHSAQIVSAYNILPDGTLTNGIKKIIGKYGFMINNPDNRTFIFEVLRFRINTTQGVQISNVGAYIESDPVKKTPTANPVDGVVELFIGNFLIMPGTTTVTFVLFGDIIGTEIADVVQSELTGVKFFNGFEIVSPDCIGPICFPIPGATLSN